MTLVELQPLLCRKLTVKLLPCRQFFSSIFTLWHSPCCQVPVAVMGCLGSKNASAAAEAEPSQPQWDGHIRSIRAWKIDPALTSAQLTRLRTEFWETRVEGRQEMWQALRFAAAADSDELRDETIKAAGLRPANRRGSLQSCFDERGALYEVPMYALADPTNLNEEPTQKEFKDAARAVADYIQAHDRSRRSTHRHA